jgi:propionyl-CoA synthetase
MSLPSTFKALQLEKPPSDAPKGSRNIAAIREVSMPAEASGMVLVKIAAAGFNRRDEWGMLGQYPGLIYKDSTFGCDGVGTVVRGKHNAKHPKGLVVLVPIRGWQKDEAGPEAELPGISKEAAKNGLGGSGFGLLGSTKPTMGVGTFAEYVQVEQEMIVDVPSHLDAVQAAALPCGGLTAFRALFTRGKLQKGQTLLITGIGGGVALLALQLAVAAGAKVFVTGGSAEKIKRAVELGALGGVEYKDKEWPKKLAQMVVEKSKDRPYLDVVLDSAGGEVPLQAAKAGLKQGGKVVCFGMTAVPKMTFTMREVLRNVEILGSTMGSEHEFKSMLKFVGEHKIVPIIDTVIDGLDKADQGFVSRIECIEAFHLLIVLFSLQPLLQDADKRSGGKVIVRVTDEGPKSKL